MDEQTKSRLIQDGGSAAAYLIAVLESSLTKQPTGQYETELRDLAVRMTAALKTAKRGKAEYWHKGEAERVYVTNQSGKKAGYVEMVDGKAFYREVASEDLIAIFKAARKAQKAAAL